jgi:hypothetical protein
LRTPDDFYLEISYFPAIINEPHGSTIDFVKIHFDRNGNCNGATGVNVRPQLNGNIEHVYCHRNPDDDTQISISSPTYTISNSQSQFSIDKQKAQLTVPFDWDLADGSCVAGAPVFLSGDPTSDNSLWEEFGSGNIRFRHQRSIYLLNTMFANSNHRAPLDLLILNLMVSRCDGTRDTQVVLAAWRKSQYMERRQMPLILL